MRRIRLHRRAQAYMSKMPPKRREQMADALREAADLPDVSAHPRTKALSGTHKGGYRLRVGTYRAIFWVEKADGDEEELYVDYVGPRGDAYK